VLERPAHPGFPFTDSRYEIGEELEGSSPIGDV